MRKSGVGRRLSAMTPGSHVEDAVVSDTLSAPALTASATAAARRLLRPNAQPTTGQGSVIAVATVSAPPGVDAFADWSELPALKERCAAFGIDATSAELMAAGLQLLGAQTETALEVAMLQSLRADRSTAKRRSKR